MSYGRKPIPSFPGWGAALGPGIVWMALAQGSGELIWWPYIIAKYGLTFLVLLIPACFLQYPITVEVGRYTLLTGESIFHGFIRLHRGFGMVLWILMTLSFLWFGAFASAGGTAMAALTHFPSGWSPRGQTLFWAYLTIAIFLVAILLSRVVYSLIEWFMKIVAVTTVAGLLWACLQPDVLQATPRFFAGLFGISGPPPRPWDRSDGTKLLTAITFAGLGGFWILFYSYWLRDKGSAMAEHIGRITGWTGKPETITADGFLPEASAQSAAAWRQWERYLSVDVLIGILGNLATTMMTCLLAYALLFPKGLVPQDYELAVVQSRFFEVSWGTFGRTLFLIVAAAFLTDTWLATADGVSRMQADIVTILFPEQSKRFTVRQWYYFFLALLTVITSLTMLLDQPGPLILISAAIGFAGTIIFPVALYLLNHRLLAPQLPEWARPSKEAARRLLLCAVAYFGLAVVYLWMG